MEHDIKPPEILTGAGAIALFLGVTRRQVYHWNEHAGLPCIKIGKTICARPETLRRWLEEREQ